MFWDKKKCHSPLSSSWKLWFEISVFFGLQLKNSRQGILPPRRKINKQTNQGSISLQHVRSYSRDLSQCSIQIVPLSSNIIDALCLCFYSGRLHHLAKKWVIPVKCKTTTSRCGESYYPNLTQRKWKDVKILIQLSLLQDTSCSAKVSVIPPGEPLLLITGWIKCRRANLQSFLATSVRFPTGKQTLFCRIPSKSLSKSSAIRSWTLIVLDV